MTAVNVSAGYDLVVAAGWLAAHPDPLRWRDGVGDPGRVFRTTVAQRGGAWIATTTGQPRDPNLLDGVWLHPVPLDPVLADDYLHGHCAGMLAPLYHDAGVAPRYRPRWRTAYHDVNRRIAAAVDRTAAPGATVWIHDYHLQLVPGLLRRRRADLRIGFFLHSPFPSAERFATQPHRVQLLESLCAADLLGFQHPAAADNFAIAVDRFGGGTPPPTGVFPTSVDVTAIESLACRAEVRADAAQVGADLGAPDTVVLAVGAPEQAESSHRLLEAYAELLAERRIDPNGVTLVYIAVCSDDPSHLRCDRQRLDRLIAQINGVYSRLGRPAVHYMHRELPLASLVGLYLAADVMLALPLHDGMNLAAKEYLAARVNNTGRLVLSEFSGAAADLPEADLVNPYDIDAVKTAVVAATEAPARGADIAAMRDRMRRHDAAAWARSFLSALADAGDSQRSRRPVGVGQ
jgi:trehalose 6-phosphate synthase